MKAFGATLTDPSQGWAQLGWVQMCLLLVALLLVFVVSWGGFKCGGTRACAC